MTAPSGTLPPLPWNLADSQAREVYEKAGNTFVKNIVAKQATDYAYQNSGIADRYSNSLRSGNDDSTDVEEQWSKMVGTYKTQETDVESIRSKKSKKTVNSNSSTSHAFNVDRLLHPWQRDLARLKEEKLKRDRGESTEEPENHNSGNYEEYTGSPNSQSVFDNSAIRFNVADLVTNPFILKSYRRLPSLNEASAAVTSGNNYHYHHSSRPHSSNDDGSGIISAQLKSPKKSANKHMELLQNSSFRENDEVSSSTRDLRGATERSSEEKPKSAKLVNVPSFNSNNGKSLEEKTELNRDRGNGSMDGVESEESIISVDSSANSNVSTKHHLRHRPSRRGFIHVPATDVFDSISYKSADRSSMPATDSMTLVSNTIDTPSTQTVNVKQSVEAKTERPNIAENSSNSSAAPKLGTMRSQMSYDQPIGKIVEHQDEERYHQDEDGDEDDDEDEAIGWSPFTVSEKK